jgi:hypothetical protein
MHTFEEQLQRSHERFVNAVWPELKDRWFRGGELLPVQMEPGETMRSLDANAGLDFLVKEPEGNLIGISARVQEVGPYDNFTIGITELERRRAAMQRLGAVRPQSFVQAYVTRDGRFQYAVRALADDIVRYIDSHPTGVWHKQNYDRDVPFIVVWASALEYSEECQALARWGNADAIVNVGASRVRVKNADWLNVCWTCPTCSLLSTGYERSRDATAAGMELAAWALTVDRAAGYSLHVCHDKDGAATLAAELDEVLRRWPHFVPEHAFLRRATEWATDWKGRDTSLGERIEGLFFGIWETGEDREGDAYLTSRMLFRCTTCGSSLALPGSTAAG